MKRTPQMQQVVDRMAPGAVCREGFLGGDARSLEEILDADDAAVAALGLTHERIAQRLSEVYRAAVDGLGTPVEVAPGVTAAWREAMGRIPSPWPGEGTFAKGEVEVADAATAERLRFTPLGIHLIRRHGFYQGRPSRYRLEPETLARVLRLSVD